MLIECNISPEVEFLVKFENFPPKVRLRGRVPRAAAGGGGGGGAHQEDLEGRLHGHGPVQGRRNCLQAW